MIISGLIIGGTLYCLGLDIAEARNKKVKNIVQLLPENEAFKDKPKTTFLERIATIVKPDTRNQQLKEFGTIEKSEEEKLVDKKLGLSLVMLGGAIASKFYLPFLGFFLLPAISLSYSFYKKAWTAITKERKVTLETLDAIIITTMIVSGYFVLAAVDNILYFVTRKLLLKTEDSSARNMGDILKDMPKKVWLVKNNIEVQIPLEQLQVGEIISINGGEMIPVDSKIVKGFALIDERMLTGESQPVEKKIGDTCLAATLLLEGKIQVQVEKVKEETVAYKVGDALKKGLDYRDEITAKGQKAADQTALPLMVFTGLSYPFVGPVGSLAIGMSSYGYNIRMTSPLIVLNYLSVASEEGILIKDGRALEQVSKVDTIVFDKTGTLTLTQPSFECIHKVGVLPENEVLRYAAAAEDRQTHPIALAILEEAKFRDLELLEVEHIKVELGYGLKANVEKSWVSVGSAKYMKMEAIPISEDLLALERAAHLKGHSFVYVALDYILQGAIEISPMLRPEAKEVVQQLKSRGLDCCIISGDHLLPTRQLAQKVGISNYFAEVLPHEKANLVTDFQKKGKTVCFVGDGINDAIALKKANVSISLNGATTIATDTAQIIMIDESLKKIPLLFELGTQYDQNRKNNFLSSAAICGFTILGVYTFNFGVVAAFWLNKISLWKGLGNSFEPLLNYNSAKKEQKKLTQVTQENKPITSTVEEKRLLSTYEERRNEQTPFVNRKADGLLIAKKITYAI